MNEIALRTTGASGNLTVFNTKDLPFPVKRLFTLSCIESPSARGRHAHRHCQQFLIVLSGQVVGEIRTLADGEQGWAKRVVTLGDGDTLHLPTMVWFEFLMHPGSNLIVLASEEYNEDEYIRDFNVFLLEAAASRASNLSSRSKDITKM